MATLTKAAAFCGIVFLLSAGSIRVSWGQTQTLTTFYTAPVVSMAPMWIAKEIGFFKKQGLDVRIVFIPSGPTGVTAILAGEADVGVIGGFAPIRAIVGGAKGLAIIGETKNAIVATIVGKKEITTVQDLKGKRLGIDRIGSNPDMFTQAALSRFQMDPLRDLQYIQMGNIGQGIPALKAGAIDALTASPPDDLVAQKLGFHVILDITAMKIPFAATVLVSSRNTVTRKQPELTKFMQRLCRSGSLLYYESGRSVSGHRQIHQSSGPRSAQLCHRDRCEGRAKNPRGRSEGESSSFLD